MWHIPIIWEYVANRALDISSLNLADLATIMANYVSLMRGDKDHDSALLGRGYTAEQLKAVKSKKQAAVEMHGLRFTVPLINFKYERMHYVLILFENYERGILPYPGSVSEQPAQIMEILSLLKTLKQEFQTQLNNKK